MRPTCSHVPVLAVLLEMLVPRYTCAVAVSGLFWRAAADEGNLTTCPGYSATNVVVTDKGMTANLGLAGPACNAFGTDLQDLRVKVECQTATRLHVLISDADSQVYQVPTSILDRPSPDPTFAGCNSSDYKFDHVDNPFSFSVTRRSNNEILFDSSAAKMVFENQYVRLRTRVPSNPWLYGLGEHSDGFMLNTTNYTRAIWNRDAYGTPAGTNLYGAHPVYFDHRGNLGTHAVFLLNSNGMDVKIDHGDGGKDQYVEYNTLGGVLDFYFLSGPTPEDAARQYSDVVGRSAMFPYWSLGFHQCRYGMQDVWEVAEVVANYSAAAIPLETMWTDIDYMQLRRVFTLDPDRFPLKLMKDLVSTLHSRHQRYVMMVDPAVARQDYGPYRDGKTADAFMKRSNGSTYEGVVWPGPTVFPDWFANGTQDWWDKQFQSFFGPDDGVDIDALWIDMNEPANFCDYPCRDPDGYAKNNSFPPTALPSIRTCAPRNITGFPSTFQPCGATPAPPGPPPPGSPPGSPPPGPASCHASVEFAVKADTYFGENVYVLGNASTIGNGDVAGAVLLNPKTYPIWKTTVDMPPNTVVSYEYVRKGGDGTWTYEKTNRTTKTKDCGCTTNLNDNISTPKGSSPPKPYKKSDKLLPRDSDSPPTSSSSSSSSSPGNMTGLPNRNLTDPPYKMANAAGPLSQKTLDTDLIHANGLAEYDTHNLYGAMTSEASRKSMVKRRPSVRPLVITRSTFAGSGRQVGHWLGDNVASWDGYLASIRELVAFSAFYQVPMVGADVCGFSKNTTEHLCARWAALGAFSPFYRSHQESGTSPHEFYRFGNDSVVAKAARRAIDVRYRLLDYLYTALRYQNQTGTPALKPMFFAYPNDTRSAAVQHQYMYGPAVLVAPVTRGENDTTADVWLPQDVVYDFFTGARQQGQGQSVERKDVGFDEIPLYYVGGHVVPQRVASANTTTALRDVNFELVVAPGSDGRANGTLYLDDGDSINQPTTSDVAFSYDGGKLNMTGTFGYNTTVVIEKVRILGDGNATVKDVRIPLTGPYNGTLL